MIQRQLGAGGGASVWEVLDPATRERFALKIPHLQTTLAERLLREGRVQAGLRHPNLLPVLRVLEIDGRPGLLMPLVRGPSLEALLQHYRPARDEALALFRGVTAGVGHAHAQGLIHRDLKPANVLLDPGPSDASPRDLAPRVADFGVAKSLDLDGLRTRTGAVLGTPAYMAPEQLRDASRVDHRADLWSLGVMLYELLLGRRPFAAGSFPALIHAHGLGAELSELPSGFQGLIAALLQPDPAARPSSCEALLACLEGLAPQAGGLLGAGGALALAAAALSPQELAEGGYLPRRGATFVGRGEALVSLAALLGPEGEDRLITLTGTGGTGKTSLALELVHRHPELWPGGRWFVDLTEVRDASGLLEAVGWVLEVDLGRDPQGQLGRVIEGLGPALFVLDNFEQLVASGRAVLNAWLAAAPEARFLVTSRIPLQAEGERVYPLDTLSQEEAVELFQRRARAARPGFVVDEGARPALLQVLALLDGLPLAIELAAARARTMSLDRLLAYLDRRFQVLTSRSTELPPRQRSLRVALQGSWDLLSEAAQQALAQVSVFEGGFTAEAAEAVIEVAGDPFVDDLLAELSDAGLLQARGRGGTPRSAMLFSIQEFAREQLSDSDSPRARHARYFAVLDRPSGQRRAPSLALLEDFENLYAAAQYAIDLELPEVAANCAETCGRWVEHRGAPTRALALLQRVRGGEGLPPALRIRLAVREGRLAFIAGDLPRSLAVVEAVLAGECEPSERCRALLLRSRVSQRRLAPGRAEEDIREALQIAERLGHRRLQAAGWKELGQLISPIGRQEEALTGLRKAVDLYIALGDQRGEGSTLAYMSDLLARMNRLDEMEATFGRASELASLTGDVDLEQSIVYFRALMQQQTAQVDEARVSWERCIELARRHGATLRQMVATNSLGTLEFRMGRLGQAERVFRRSLSAIRSGEANELARVSLMNLGYLCFRTGRGEDAEEMLLQAADMAERAGSDKELVYTLAWLGDLYTETGRGAEAAPVLEKALTAAARSGDDHVRGIAWIYQGSHLFASGAREAADRAFDEAVACLRRAGHPFFEAIAMSTRLDASLTWDDDELAWERATAALQACERARAPVGRGRALGCLGELAARRGDLAAARARHEQAEALLRAAEDLPELARLLVRRAEVALRAGELEAAEGVTARAAQIIESMGCGPEAPLARQLGNLRRGGAQRR